MVLPITHIPFTLSLIQNFHGGAVHCTILFFSCAYPLAGQNETIDYLGNFRSFVHIYLALSLTPFFSLVVTMPQGIHYTQTMKEIFFRVIDFVEVEKNGPQIPMHNATVSITAMLGISESSLSNLKKEMRNARVLQEAEKKKEEEEKEARCLRSRSTSKIPPTKISHKKHDVKAWATSHEMNPIRPKAPRKISGRSSIHLSEEADDKIRFQFHLLLAEKIYPTISILLERLLAAHPDFPVRSHTSLQRYMHRLGFSYKTTSKVKVALDNNSFIAQRAFYFRQLDELRKAGALIMFHDETWVNIGEEKRSIWIDEYGKGRIRKTNGKSDELDILFDAICMYSTVNELIV